MRVVLIAVALVFSFFVANNSYAKKCKNKKWKVVLVTPKTDEGGHPVKVRVYRIGVRVKGHGFWKVLSTPNKGQWTSGTYTISETDTFGYKCNLRRQLRIIYKCYRYYNKYVVSLGKNVLDWHEDFGNTAVFSHGEKGNFNWGAYGLSCEWPIKG